MDDNRYAPPKADVEGAPLEGVVAPPLWNPNAAANWSLLFTPIFGCWLHMLNWRALGETERAESAKTWLMLSSLMLVGLNFVGVLVRIAGSAQITGLVSFVLLLTWYFASARGQARWVAERYGNRYPRKGWWQPLLGAVVLSVANSVAILFVAAISRMMLPR
jgi:hypothetical protein